MAFLSLCVCPSRIMQTNNILNYVLKGFCTLGAFKFPPIMSPPHPFQPKKHHCKTEYNVNDPLLYDVCLWYCALAG